MPDDQDDLTDYIQKKVEEFKAMATDKNIDAIGAGMGAVAGYAALGAEVGAAAVGATAAAGLAVPAIALGVGLLTFKAFGKFARYAVRKLDNDLKNRNRQDEPEPASAASSTY